MTADERDSVTNQAFQEFRQKFAGANATPVFCIAIGHAPGPRPGDYVCHFVGNTVGNPMNSEGIYFMLKSMLATVAADLKLDPKGVS